MIPYLVVLALVAAALAWFFFGGRAEGAEPWVRRPTDEDIDRAELEAAEREVQEAPGEDEVRDWGPGAGGSGIA